MDIRILGAESLGVRGLACAVAVGDRRVVIDPGVALGFRRHGLLPHPVQVAQGERVRAHILQALAGATDVVFSHFHGDHVPMPDANPYQLDAELAAPLCRAPRLWCKGPRGMSEALLGRRRRLAEILDRELPDAEGRRDGSLCFSASVPHGEPDTGRGTVMMTRVEDADGVFVHASDCQLLEPGTVSAILDWKPDVVLTAGPPVYLGRLSPAQVQAARDNARRLARGVTTLILDHHLLRAREGEDWLRDLSEETGGRVICAADFMGEPRRLYEADRRGLYRRLPVPPDWHEDYARGRTDTAAFRDGGFPEAGV